MSAAPLELAWWGSSVGWGGMMVRWATDGTGNHSALELGEDAGRTSDRDEPLRPLLKLATLMLLSGTRLPRRHGLVVTPRSDTTFSRAPDSARKARLEFTSILPVRERLSGTPTSTCRGFSR